MADCASRRTPEVRLNESTVTPSTVRAGSVINHRLIYTLCSKSPAAVTGMMRTAVYAGGSRIFTNDNNNYELKPGRWVVDTNISIPADAKPGSYTLDTAFKSRAAQLSDTAFFRVEP